VLPVLAAVGCTASAEEVRPPRDQLAFPTGMAVSPDEHSLFVVNANSELRFDSGSIGVIDLDLVEAVISSWAAGTIPAGYDCTQDPDHTETLQCSEQKFFKADSGVRVGNFATDLRVQAFSDGGAVNLRVFVPTRGDPSVAWADYDGDRLHCNSSAESYPLCDDAHRLTSLDNDPDLAALPNEPFGVFTHVIPTYDGNGNRLADRGFAMVSHLATGSVTLIDAPADSAKVRIVDMVNNVFLPDVITGTGLRGATTMAGRPMPTVAPPPPVPAVADEMVYVVSSSEDRVQTFTVGQRDGSAAYLLPGSFFFLNAVGNGAGNSNDTRGVAFSASFDRLYLVNRLPPSVQVYDTSITASGIPRNTPLGSSDVCRQASTLAVANLGDPVGDRVYVTCFQDGQVYVVDPTGQSQVEDIISVGRGPFAAAVITGKNLPGNPQQLLVSNFLEDTIAVIDLSLTSPKRNRVVLRIGTPRAP
jgi:YVTN family beta-propeller protein